jgi:hypothetical protein
VLRETLSALGAMEDDLRAVLGSHEGAKDRVITIEQSYARLARLSVAQDDLMHEAISATQYGLYRSAHVAAWAALMDAIHDDIAVNGLAALQAVRPKWVVPDIDALKQYGDYELIEAAKAAKVYTNTFKKTLHSLLHRRNECAHPGGYNPDLNAALGYLSEILSAFEALQKMRT